MRYHSRLNSKKFPMMYISQLMTVCLGRSGFSNFVALGKDRSVVCPSQINLFTWVFSLHCTACTEVFLFSVVNFVGDSEQFYYGGWYRPDCLQGSLGSSLPLSAIKSALVFRLLKKNLLSCRTILAA